MSDATETDRAEATESAAEQEGLPEADAAAPATKASDTDLLEQEGEYAADYLEAFLDIVDLDGDLDIDVDNGRAVVAVVGDRLDQLVGPGGETLEALQELTRLAVLARSGSRSRLMLDVGGYRARRRAELSALGTETAERVAESGEAERLKPMTPFERKIVHDAVAAVDGVHSESEGEEPQRRVVVLPG